MRLGAYPESAESGDGPSDSWKVVSVPKAEVVKAIERDRTKRANEP